VAAVMRDWYACRGEAADRLLVPSFVLGDPWRTINTASVPYWTFFSVQPALRAFAAHLERSAPYREIDILLFQHGVESAGIAQPDEWTSVARRHGATPRLLALDRDRFPHDIASLARYGRAMAGLPSARSPWSPLELDRALDGLRREGLAVGRPGEMPTRSGPRTLRGIGSDTSGSRSKGARTGRQHKG
jgi:hypothetical protein